MKSISKRLISIITAAVVSSGFVVTSAANAATTTTSTTSTTSTASTGQALTGYYATNPNGQVGKNKTITIDGSFSDWSEDMLIAQGVANDDPRIFRGSHEGPVYDTYALFAAWDDTNVYFMWEYTNVTDVVDPAQGYPISDNGKPWNGNIPIMLAFNTGSGDYTDGTASDGKSVWGLNVNFTTKVDKVACFSSKPGVGLPSIFSSVNGKLDYTSAQLFKTAGATYKYGDGCISSKINGINANGYSGYTPADLLSSSSKWVDFKTTKHDSAKQDTMYEIAIPLKALGMTKSDLESKGLGVMQISTFGASGIGSLPMDMTFLDNATKPYGPDASTSEEKEDVDNVTVPLAQVGKGGTVVPTPSISALNTNVASPQALGKTVQLTAAASGGTGTLQYQYSVNGQVISAYSSNPVYNWTPTDAGDYTVQVSVKDSNGQVSTKSITYTIVAPVDLTISSFNGNTTTSQAGTAVTLTANASGGTGTLQYMITATNGTSTSTIKSYSNSNTATWTPTTAGTYTLTVSVKDGSGKVATKQLSYVVTAKPVTCAISKVTTSVASPQVAGTAINLKISAVGTGTLQYKFAVVKDGTVAYVRSFSTSSSTTWTPTEAGTYTLYLYAKDSTGTIAPKSMTYVVTQPNGITVSGITTSVKSPQVAGTSITVTTNATSSNTLSYRYWVCDPNGDWSLLRTFSSSNSVSFKPTLAGQYTIWVDVKDSKGTMKNSYITYDITK